MKCLKCEKEVPFMKFCGECGEQRLEICEECGKLELIGRSLCQTSLEKAQEKRNAYVHGITAHVNGSALLVVFCTAISLVLITAHFNGGAMKTFDLVAPFVVAILGFYLVVRWCIRFEHERTKKFPEKFPEEAEILRKASKKIEQGR